VESLRQLHFDCLCINLTSFQYGILAVVKGYAAFCNKELMKNRFDEVFKVMGKEGYATV
jgi:hypothetical protein